MQPRKDINTNTKKIQVQDDIAHIYDEIGKHLISIPYNRLAWLWTQHNQMLHQLHDLIPPTQTFEIKITWLYQRYKHRISKNDPLKNSHHALLKVILDYITTSFNVTHSYFSSSVTCSTQLTKFFSPFPRDKLFGSLGTTFSHRWQGIGCAHPHNENEAQTTIH